MLKMRLFTRKLAILSVLAVFVGTAGVTAQTQQQVMTGHVTWTTLEGFNECHAAIAGLVRNQVLWFNDQVLIDNFAIGDRWIYVSEAGAPDPRDHVLAFVQNYTFDDPNGNWWNVTEWQYFAGLSLNGTETPQARPGPGSPPMSASVHGRERVMTGPHYAWTVKVMDQPDEDMHRGPFTDHSLYNFVAVIDVCKFLGPETGSVAGWEENPQSEHDPTPNPEFPYRPSSGEDPTHLHKTYEADVSLGLRPDGRGLLIPLEKTGADYRQDGSNQGEHYGHLP